MASSGFMECKFSRRGGSMKAEETIKILYEEYAGIKRRIDMLEKLEKAERVKYIDNYNKAHPRTKKITKDNLVSKENRK